MKRMKRRWRQLVKLVRSHALVAGAVVAAGSFLLGQWVGGNRSGAIAEWFTGAATVAAVVAALWIASASSRETRRERQQQLTMRFLTVVEEDWRQTKARNQEVRSPEGVALAHVLRPAGLNMIAADYYTDPDNLRRIRQIKLGAPPGLTADEVGKGVQADAIRLVERLSAP
jgi:hypothetical protein